MQNLLLLHCREQRKLSPEQIELKTGIPVSRYRSYENAQMPISLTDIELLSGLLKIRQEYLIIYSHQLDVFTAYKGILDVKDQKIKELTSALKRTIEVKPSSKK